MARAKLTRTDYAVAVTRRDDVHKRRIAEAVSFAIAPAQVSATMPGSYADQLLAQLREMDPKSDELVQISIDCPVEISIDRETLATLIQTLEGERS